MGIPGICGASYETRIFDKIITLYVDEIIVDQNVLQILLYPDLLLVINLSGKHAY